MSLLKEGDYAPDFTIPTKDKTFFRLSEHVPGQKTVLLFFPGAFSSTCTTEVNEINNDLESYQDAGAQVLGISTDSPFVLAEFAKVNNLKFQLLSDHDGITAEAYGAKYNGDFTDMKLSRIAKRSAFVIDEDCRILYAEVLENAGQQPNFEAIKQTLNA